MRVLRFLRDTAVDLCLGCRHNRTTRPFTIENESYLVCLDCGKQVFYSVEDMRRLSGRELRLMRAARHGGLRVVPEPAAAIASSKVDTSHLAA